jgi:hypothetical protein
MCKTNIFSITKTKKSATWTSEEDKILLSLTTGTRNKWSEISKALNTKTPQQCFLRFRAIRPDIKKGSWAKEEDEELLIAFKKYGKKWKLIAKDMKTRSSKQVRDRYTNYLDPTLDMSDFTLNEDLKLLELIERYGNKWALIGKHFLGRSFYILKNRYNSGIKNNLRLYKTIKNLSGYRFAMPDE